jgi:hypothetical protein
MRAEQEMHDTVFRCECPVSECRRACVPATLLPVALLHHTPEPGSNTGHCFRRRLIRLSRQTGSGWDEEEGELFPAKLDSAQSDCFSSLSSPLPKYICWNRTVMRNSFHFRIGKQYLITRPGMRDESLVRTGLPRFHRKEYDGACRGVRIADPIAVVLDIWCLGRL